MTGKEKKNTIKCNFLCLVFFTLTLVFVEEKFYDGLILVLDQEQLLHEDELWNESAQTSNKAQRFDEIFSKVNFHIMGNFDFFLGIVTMCSAIFVWLLSLLQKYWITMRNWQILCSIL